MPPVVAVEKQKRYVKLRSEGWPRTAACREVGVSESWAFKFDHGHADAGKEYRKAREEAPVPLPRAFDDLCGEAKRGLEDFEFFRRFYLGHVSTPWQVKTAYRLVELRESPHKEFTVINLAPGSGKSTLITDIGTWATCRERSVRGLMGSRKGANARRQVVRIKRNLERVQPYKAPTEDIDRGLAVDAESTLAAHYGLFKPPTHTDVWRAEEFVVAQMDEVPIEEKEPTWSSYGRDGGVLGNRFDLIFWDDLVDRTNTRTYEVQQDVQDWWDEEAESRLEPRGLLVLIGQRMAASDLYHYCINKTLRVDDEAGPDEVVEDRMYEHIVYPAHDELICEGVHKPSEAKPWPDGCLLDPYRLPWRDLKKIKDTNPQRFEVLYQQKDGSAASRFIRDEWLTGGTDPEDGSLLPGCYDNDRTLGEFPVGLNLPYISIATVDPSVTNMWACLAAGTAVATLRGEVPIEGVTTDDRVLTRDGWRSVQHRTFMGVKPTVTLRLSTGRTLTLTPDHRVAVPGGWREAGSLAPGDVVLSAALPVARSAEAAHRAGRLRTEDGVFGRELMAAQTMGLSDLRGDVRGTAHVDLAGDVLEMLRVDARPVATQVVDLPADFVVDEVAVGQSMSQLLAVPADRFADRPVPVDLRPSPLPTAALGDVHSRGEEGGIDDHPVCLGDGPVAADDAHLSGPRDDRVPAHTSTHVVSLTDGPSIAVYDIGVEGDRHEFTAEGVIVHNCQWWIYTPEASHQVFLMDLINQSMPANDLLDWNANTGSFYGVMEDWQARSVELGLPITHWVVEANAAHRYLLAYDHMRRWQSKWSVHVIPHTTSRTKLDPNIGPDIIRDHFRFGRVRLPRSPRGDARLQTNKLIDQLKNYRMTRYDDQVMACWFLFANLPQIAPSLKPLPSITPHPSWLVA